MKIISWNVNGLRALHNQNYWNWFLNESPDIFCIQETKASSDQLPDEVKNPNGYFSYFSSSQTRKGYSGVATYTKEKPIKVIEGLGEKRFDEQGRTLTLKFNDFNIINAYVPNGASKTAPLDFKLDYYSKLLDYMNSLNNVILCGDINVAHEEIDIARPKENKNSIGFLLVERERVDEILNNGYIDIFRHFYPDKINAYTYWDMVSRARERNVGWRLDYFFISSSLLPRIKSTSILSNVYGSDHCPILLEL